MRRPLWIIAALCLVFTAGFYAGRKTPTLTARANKPIDHNIDSINKLEHPLNRTESEHEAKAGSSKSDSRCFVDCDIPGTEVYLANQKLGSVPLELTGEQLRRLGLDPARSWEPDQFLGEDGWGEGLLAGIEDEQETKIMFKIPPDLANNYLSIETPWGLRTKCCGMVRSSASPVSLAYMFRRRRRLDRLELGIDFQKQVKRSDKAVRITATLKNSNGKSVSGFRPEIELFWGTFSTPWRRRTTSEFKLTPEWATIEAGESQTITLEIPTPSVSEDYSVFAVFNLFSAADGDQLIGDGAVYSDSKLLKVR